MKTQVNLKSEFARTGKFKPSAAPRITPCLEKLVKEARAEYKLGKLKVFDNVDDLLAHLNS